ncbi:HNH endonuclease [Cellvibrio mixtus]|uniref:HNH endonuclease n=1 Tax=Cellvibrio mixtus TaxID=39650 RepID=UPI0006941060|nr:HNH endonuclease [Cellvibrio mixtus]
MEKERENFPAKVKEQIAREAMYICSCPDCYRFTGYNTTEGKARTIAEGAHILAAGKAGPRADETKDSDFLRSAENGIWLCSICHKKADDDPTYYSELKLKEWKANHHELLRRLVGKDIETALLALGNEKRHYQNIREFLSFMDNSRVLYEGLDGEFPPRVLDSIEMMRARVVQLRAQVVDNKDAFAALNQIQFAINEFLSGVGSDTDLRTLKCNSHDPKWLKFADELIKFRKAIVIILKVLSTDSSYELHWAL